LDSAIKNAVLPVLEHFAIEEDNLDSSVIKIPLISEAEYLNKIMTISGSNIRHFAVTYIKVANNRDFLPALLPLKKYRNKAVGQLAYDTYIQLLKKD